MSEEVKVLNCALSELLGFECSLWDAYRLFNKLFENIKYHLFLFHR